MIDGKGKPFVCVFNEVDRDKLINAGLHMLQNDTRNGIYIFYKDESLTYALADIECMLIDRLTF